MLRLISTAAAGLLLLSSCTGLYEPDPQAPTQVSARASGETAAELGILVTWNAAADSGGYTVYRSDDGGSTYEPIGSTGPQQLSYLDRDDDLVLGSTYTYKVRSYGLWHSKTGELSGPSSGVDYFLTPVWNVVLQESELSGSAQAAAVRMASAGGGVLYYILSDTAGKLYVGRVVEEEDEDNEDEYRFTVERYGEFSAETAAAAEGYFDAAYADGTLYLAFSDADHEGKLSVLALTAEEEEGELTWSTKTVGTRGFTDESVSSVSLAAAASIGGTRIYLSCIEGSGKPKVRSREIGTLTPDWKDLTPAAPAEVLGIGLALNGSALTVGFRTAAGFELAGTSDNSVLASFSPAPAGIPGGSSTVRLSSSGDYFTIEAYAENTGSWVIRDLADGEWRSSGLEQLPGFSSHAEIPDLSAPFNASLNFSGNLLLAASDPEGGIRSVFFDRETERWFSYGKPGGSLAASSVNVLSIGTAHYVTWVEDETAMLSVGR
jgi:hypothetical protein